jgi:hypothetical protein
MAGGGGMMGMAGGGMMPPQGGSGMGGPMGPAGAFGGQKGVAPGNLTPNNSIERNRYLQAPKKDATEAEKPSRHLPLAIQLIVDPAHMSDVLVAMANSRLRLQITQVEFHRVKDIKPADKNSDGTQLLRTGFMPGGMGMGMGMGSGMMPPRGGSGMMPPGGGSGRMPGMGSGMMPPNSGSGRMPPGGGSGRMPGMGSGMMPPGGGSGRMPPGGGSGRMPGMGSGMMPPMPGMGSGMKPSMPGIVTPTGMPPRGTFGPTQPPGDSKNKPAANQADDNLVEMTVYAIATLYRRPDPTTNPQADSTGQANPSGSVTPPAPSGTGR